MCENPNDVINQKLQELSSQRKNFTQDGKKEYFKCRIHENCEYQLMIYSPATNESKLIFELNEHGNQIKQKKSGLQESERDKIKECFDIGLTKPSEIKDEFRRLGLQFPQLFKVKNFLQKLRDEAFGTKILYLNELEQWANDNSSVPDDDDDQAYVAGSFFDYRQKEFSIVVTSKRLLFQAQNADFIQADATYKLNWNGFPLLVAGNSDKNRVFILNFYSIQSFKNFHPVCFALTSHEKQSNFSVLFGVIKTISSEMSYIVSDGAEAILNAAKEYWPSIKRIDCFFHIYK